MSQKRVGRRYLSGKPQLWWQLNEHGTALKIFWIPRGGIGQWKEKTGKLLEKKVFARATVLEPDG